SIKSSGSHTVVRFFIVQLYKVCQRMSIYRQSVNMRGLFTAKLLHCISDHLKEIDTSPLNVSLERLQGVVFSAVRIENPPQVVHRQKRHSKALDHKQQM